MSVTKVDGVLNSCFIVLSHNSGDGQRLTGESCASERERRCNVESVALSAVHVRDGLLHTHMYYFDLLKY